MPLEIGTLNDNPDLGLVSRLFLEGFLLAVIVYSVEIVSGGLQPPPLTSIGLG